MTTHTKRRRSAAAGLKALVTASALVATVAGWAALTDGAQTTALSETPSGAAVAVAPPPDWLQRAPDVPDLPPVATAQLAPDSDVAANSQLPAAQPAQPAADQAPAVTAPQAAPAPVTTTRSSR